MSQWKTYLVFCSDHELDPLPAEMETILLYLAFLAESKSYNSIPNYLSAVWSLHKLHGYKHIDPSAFEITMTLRGIRRVIGSPVWEARPVTVYELRHIFSTLNLLSSEDIAFWLAILLCFRGLLRKSNVCELGLAILCSDVTFHSWGVLIHVRRSKTICFGERVLQIPFNKFNKLSASIFCVEHSHVSQDGYLPMV